MVSFAILAFFAITGLTLNHSEAFSSGKPHTTQTKGTVPAQ
ncbi:MAG: PepSY-associated TM helix domain-containing protein, partial [Bryobacteraceae bacterium]|nr:PepSY-associated TM helix domain-containing protein [Bryobacteraceae bacterium]